MSKYSKYSLEALKQEKQQLTNIKRLMCVMEKPKNFTYMDVLDLHTAVDTLIEIIQEEINNR